MSDTEHQLLLDAIKEHAIFMIDVNGYIISWNEGAKGLKGYEDVEVLGKHFRMLFLPQDQDTLPEKELQEALEKGKFEEEWWRLRKDGSIFWAHVILQPIYDKSGEHIGFAKITTDKTEQKRINELNTFLMNEVSGYAIFLLDKNTRIAKWSKAAESIFQYNEEEIIGKSLKSLYGHQHNGKENHSDDNFHKADEKIEYERWSTRKDGSRFWASFIVGALHNQDGYVVLLKDLTDQKTLDHTLKNNIALTASNRELERFAYVLSHDLKEPIRKILTYSHLLEPHTPLQQKYIDKIIASSTRVNYLIEDILKFSTLTGEHPFEETDLNVVLQNVLESLSEVINERKAVVSSSSLPKAKVIASQIEQLLQNLISNAIKFCSADNGETPRINIEGKVIGKQLIEESELHAMLPSEKYLQLAVKDNGIGFNQKYAEKIFELFQRLHSKSEFEGTGVGLSICKKVVENHGGSISARSRENEGALFIVTLPMQ